MTSIWSVTMSINLCIIIPYHLATCFLAYHVEYKQ